MQSIQRAPWGYCEHYRGHFLCFWSHEMSVFLSWTNRMLIWVNGQCEGLLTSGWERTAGGWKVQQWTRKAIGVGLRLSKAFFQGSHSGTVRHVGVRVTGLCALEGLYDICYLSALSLCYPQFCVTLLENSHLKILSTTYIKSGWHLSL